MSVPEKGKKYASMYVLKAIGAFFVVCIHTKACVPATEPLLRLAVPIFFMISGFFIYDAEWTCAQKKLKKSLRKVFWLTVYANIFYYFVFYLPLYPIPLNSFQDILQFIFFGKYFGSHLWYLTAYIEVVLLVLLAGRFKALNFLWGLTVVFLIGGILLGKYHILYDNVAPKLILSRNCLTIGLPFFGMGWLLRKYQSRIKLRYSVLLLMTVALTVISYMEEYALIRLYNGRGMDGDLLFSSYPLALLFMILCMKHSNLGNGSFIEKIGQKYADGIYIYHLFIAFCIMNCSKHFTIPPALLPFVCFFVTLAFVICWRALQRQVISLKQDG